MNKPNALLSNAVIMSDLQFSSCSSRSWNVLWIEAFESGYHPPQGTTIGDEYIPKVYKKLAIALLEIFYIRKLCVCVTRLLDIKSRLVLCLQTGSPIPFRFSSLRLGCQ